MSIERTIAGLLAMAAMGIVVGASSAAPAPSHASILIRHQVRGCHSWAVNGGPFRATQTLSLRHGGWFTLTNNDVMPQKLIQTSGPAVRVANLATHMMGMGKHGPAAPGMMQYMGAATKVLFAKPGVYHFTTKPGEDYMPGMKTVGEDNVLRLTVTVS